MEVSKEQTQEFQECIKNNKRGPTSYSFIIRYEKKQWQTYPTDITRVVFKVKKLLKDLVTSQDIPVSEYKNQLKTYMKTRNEIFKRERSLKTTNNKMVFPNWAESKDIKNYYAFSSRLESRCQPVPSFEDYVEHYKGQIGRK